MEIKVVLLVCSLFVGGLADINMHNPRGGNNRLNENSRERRNAKRLFDSQNNNRGGHNVGDVMYYYAGSNLQIQWAHQHSCGDENNHCEVIIQYMCDKTVRDGKTTKTNQIHNARCKDNNCNTDPSYGMHESFDYYLGCFFRERNKGLFTGDQNLGGGRHSARFTRQESKGTRYGYECPEERDYYPYWHPSPWKDIAVLTNDPTRCSYYQQESENVKGRGYCKVIGHAGMRIRPNNEKACLEFKHPRGTYHGEWINQTPHGLPAPDCVKSQWSRDNHQGNTIGGYFMTYNWTIPDIDEDKCVMRIRYNISTGEYDGWNPDVNYKLNGIGKLSVGSRYGLDFNTAAKRGYVLGNNPSVSIFGDVPGFKLQANIDTSQFGRTFQDRSHVFAIRKRPASLTGKTIHNINVRGKRGNIVQVFPSTEYDFVPNTVVAKEGDYVHFQWTGSDTNPKNNAGQGNRGTDRSNVILIRSDQSRVSPCDQALKGRGRGEEEGVYGNWARNYPAKITKGNLLGFSVKDLVNLATIRDSTYFDLGPRPVSGKGTYYYMSTRNNAFTNRSQKGRIIVTG